eukprot:4500976-Prymnesium_polylepis.1
MRRRGLRRPRMPHAQHPPPRRAVVRFVGVPMSSPSGSISTPTSPRAAASRPAPPTRGRCEPRRLRVEVTLRQGAPPLGPYRGVHVFRV